MSEPVQQLPTAVMAAMRQIMRPLVRLMIRHGITLPSMVELLKQVLVDTVDKDLPVEGKRTTDSRVSVLTGVHRKDVKRLRDSSAKPSDIPKKMSLGTQVVNAWLTEPAWLNAKGEPLALPRTSDDHHRPSFEQLTESISNDVRPRAVLDELRRTGVVTVRDNGLVELLAPAYIPAEAEEEKLYYFEKASYAHLMAGVQNLEGVSPAFFDRVVQYQSLPASAIPLLQELLEHQGMALLQDINVKARQNKRKDADNPRSIAIGLFFYHEPSDRS